MGILIEKTNVNLGTGGFKKQEVFAMGAPAEYYTDTMHSFAINTRETDYESIVGPLPITLKTYKQYQMHGHPITYFPSQQLLTNFGTPRAPVTLGVVRPSVSNFNPTVMSSSTPTKAESEDTVRITQPPPKKKWMREYMEEPKSPIPARVVTALSAVAPRSNGVVVRTTSSPPAPPPAAVVEVAPSSLLDFAQEHSRPRTTSNSHGPPQIPSPPSVGSSGSNGSTSGSSGSNGSTPRAGTREVHNKLEKNRRAHLKECFELLKRQLPSTQDDKKTSNLSILGSAIRYIQVLRRKERECEHEMERLAREKIAAQQRLAALKREVAVLATTTRAADSTPEEKRDDRINGQVLGIPISITTSQPQSAARMDASPPRSLNLSTKLRTLPIQITPTSSQVVRTSYGTRHNTLTLTTLSSADQVPTTQVMIQNGQTENGVTTLVHPAQIHLPLSQMVNGGGLVVGGALQLLSPAGLRVLHAPQINGIATSENSRIVRENGIRSPTPSSEGGVMVSGLPPLVVAPSGGHLLHSHTLTHKMVEAQMVKGSVAPLTLSAQYLSATTIVKPVVVVSGAATPPSTSA